MILLVFLYWWDMFLISKKPHNRLSAIGVVISCTIELQVFIVAMGCVLIYDANMQSWAYKHAHSGKAEIIHMYYTEQKLGKKFKK